MGCLQSSSAACADTTFVDVASIQEQGRARSTQPAQMTPHFDQTATVGRVKVAQLDNLVKATASASVPQPVKTFDEPASPSQIKLVEREPKNGHTLSKLRVDCKVRDLYRLTKTLGTGGFSIVKLAVEKANNKEWACKIMALPPAGATIAENENSREDIFKEIDILCRMDHSNVIYLKEFFEEGNKVYLITELLTGGELLDAVLKRGSYSEGEACLCFGQLLKGIDYLHARNVVHRDLKLENLLLAKPDDISHIKIADFGLAKKAVEGTMQTICGTPQYVAPEVIMSVKGQIYGPGVDMWSAGVVLYVLLGGYPPFWSESEPQLFDLIRRGAFTFEDPVWDNVSDGAKDLIQKLLLVDPLKRLSAKAALAHPWLSGQENSSTPLTSTKDNMKRHFKRRFRTVVSTVIATNRLGHILEALRRGELSVQGMGASRMDRCAHHEHFRRMTDAFDEKVRLRTSIDVAQGAAATPPASKCMVTQDSAGDVVSSGCSVASAGSRELELIQSQTAAAARLLQVVEPGGIW